MKQNIVPLLMYKDLRAAIDWFERAFGFQRQTESLSQQLTIDQAELRFGSGVIALRSAVADLSAFAEIRQASYVTVPDVGQHHSRVAAAGAEIVKPPSPTHHGFREYAVRDLEGHGWFFGDYVMSAGSSNITFVPELRYRNLDAAKQWLDRVFGFATTFEVRGADDKVAHSELRLGDGTVFISPMTEQEGEFSDVRAFVDVIVDDPDEHHAQAEAAGASIVVTPRDTPFGARYYAVRDPERFLWWVSTYRPAE